MTRILIIEDHAMSREMTEQCLIDEYEVVSADNGRTGVEMARKHLPDLIICDIAMPGMDGYQVLEVLRNDEATASIPFIFLTAFADRTSMRHGMNLGADDYLTKPFSVNDLRAAVRTRLKKKARREATLKKAMDELRVSITTALPHELRTAIMVIEGYIHLLLTEEEQGDPEQQAMLTAIRNNAERIHRMAEKFIWYTRAQVSIPDFDGNAVVANANEVIIRVATIICARLGRRLDLIFSLYPASLRISEENLTKIVEELVENACKFSKVGTKITLQGILEGSDYKLAVTNYGKPMTPEQVQRIGGFMQFERDKQEQQGTGLGLVIAKRLAELAGGGLGVKSDEHETVITVRLKRAADIFRENMLTVEDDDTQPLLPITDMGPGDPAAETISTTAETPSTPPTAQSLPTVSTSVPASTSIIPLKLETAGDTPAPQADQN